MRCVVHEYQRMLILSCRVCKICEVPSFFGETLTMFNLPLTMFNLPLIRTRPSASLQVYQASAFTHAAKMWAIGDQCHANSND